ncbi:MAG: fused MFS/spermidine synthase [Myxococcota bacterium]
MVQTAALALTVLTGFTALVYQVAWQNYLAVLLGSHAEATAAVLGIFLGGLSLGYALFGRVSGWLVSRSAEAGRRTPLLEAYGLVEVGIGVYALAFPWVFSGVQVLSLGLPGSAEGATFAIDVLLTVLLIGPPTLLMGGTVPLLTQGLSRSLDDATRLHAFVYGFNTVGAFGGALAAGLYLIPELGLRDCVVAMGAVNIGAGIVFMLLGRLPSAARTSDPRGQGTAPAHFHRYALVAGLGGFSMMTLQTALNRIGALSLGASHFTFAMVVAVFVLSIALGSLAVTALREIRPSYLVASQWLLVVILLAAYTSVPDAPYWASRVRLDYPGAAENFYPFHLRIFCWSLLLLVLPVSLSGASLPLIFHHLRREVGELGTTAGRLYAWNTLGSLLGALLGGYLLLLWLDLHHTYRIAVGALAIGAALLTHLVHPRTARWAYGALAAVLALLFLAPAWPATKLTSGLFRGAAVRDSRGLGPDAFIEWGWAISRGGMEIAFYDDDPSSSVAVIAHPDRPERGIAVINNGKSDGKLPGDELTMGLLALVPAILSDSPQRAFVIGYGTGYTVGILSQLASAQEVVVAEISSGVIEAAPLFEPYNFHAAGSAKTRIIRSDAYRALLRSSGRYDVIVSEPTNPWVAGVEMLYSREFLQAARNRLTPGGIYVQWFHLYEMDDATVALVLNTYRQAFERVSVWASTPSDVIIVGWNDDEAVPDLVAMERRFGQDDYSGLFATLGIDSFPELLAHEVIPAGALAGTELPPRVHTLLHPILSHSAAQAFFAGETGRLPTTNRGAGARAGAENSLVRRYLAGLPEGARATALETITRETCDHYITPCLTWTARWRHDEPDSPALARLLYELRSKNASHAKSFSEANLQQISPLFGPTGITGIPLSFEAATWVLDLFDRFYHHGAPFDSRGLFNAWRRCRMDPRCGSELPRIRQIGLPAE